MTVRLQIFVGIIIVFFLLLIANMVRKKKIELKYSLRWMVLCVLALILDIFPQLLYGCARMVGITLPSNMVFFVAIVLLISVIYSLATSVSHLSTKVKRLTQELALLREEVEKQRND